AARAQRGSRAPGALRRALLQLARPGPRSAATQRRQMARLRREAPRHHPPLRPLPSPPRAARPRVDGRGDRVSEAARLVLLKAAAQRAARFRTFHFGNVVRWTLLPPRLVSMIFASMRR